MYLVQLREYLFVDAEKIDSVNIHNGEGGHVTITLTGDDHSVSVDSAFVTTFLNHIQALNNGFVNVEAAYREYNK